MSPSGEALVAEMRPDSRNILNAGLAVEGRARSPRTVSGSIGGEIRQSVQVDDDPRLRKSDRAESALAGSVYRGRATLRLASGA